MKSCRSAIKRIDIQRNQLDDDCMASLGEYLQESPFVEELNIAYNHITDKGIEVLAEYIIGNTALNFLDFQGNREITEDSVSFFVDIATKSCITRLGMNFTSILDENKEEIEELLHVPVEQRDIPIHSNTKSAAKAE